MAGIGDIIGNIGAGGKSTFFWAIIIIGVIFLVVVIGGGLFLLWYFKKRWNLRVEIKLLRSDGKFTFGEWGKGRFDAKKGVVLIKRPGDKFRSSPMAVFDIKKYLQGTDLLTVVQVGPEDYRPVLNDSWTKRVVEYENEDTGEIKLVKEAVINIKVDDGLNKAWKSAWESSAKKAYSLSTFFQQFQTPIAIAIVIIAVFVGFAIIWARLGSMC